MRCDDLDAAVRVMDVATRQIQGVSWTKLLELARLVAKKDLSKIAQAVREAQEEYWKHCDSMDDYLRTVYSVLATPEPDAELHGQEGLLPSRPVTIEDWLWHRLSVTMSTMLVSASISVAECGLASRVITTGFDALQSLQTTIYETYGQDYFNRNRQNPLLFASVLLHSQQFERALAFLYEEPSLHQPPQHLFSASSTPPSLHVPGLCATLA